MTPYLAACNKTKQNKTKTQPARIINVTFYFAMFYQTPVETFPCQLQTGNN
jgi:hypothetical protein